MAKYHVAIIRPQNYPHSECFREVAETLHGALEALGHPVITAENSIDAQATNIILGAHLLSEEDAARLLPSCIVYNLEQLGGAGLPAWYPGLASRLQIWDYSEQNLRYWQGLPCALPPRLVEIGSMPLLRRIAPAPEQNIDVLFYGSLNERRLHVLQGLKNADVRVHAAFGVYGAERDGLIARAKLVLNLHAYPTEIFEVVRVSYLLANRVAVVTEGSPDLCGLDDAVAAYPYENLVEGCLRWLGDEEARQALAERGERIFAQRSEVDILRRVLTADDCFSTAEAAQPCVPRRLNLGSGKDWREDCLNIDINDDWRPDAVLDISQPLPETISLRTERFGAVAFGSGYFDEIVANDVLEHIPNLTAAMSAALRLLRTGGVFRIQVPYDLSWGGWQDPTHVRAFNERSWLYYTEWFWYLGWTEARFTIDKLDFVLSPIGKRLQAACPGEDLVRTPRAVDSMQVILRKQELSTEEKCFVANYLKRPERRAAMTPAIRETDTPAIPVPA